MKPLDGNQRVLVAVTTQGKRDLQALLEALNLQDDCGPVDTLVLHNAPTSVADLALRVASLGYRYAHVPKEGFAEVRNAALQFAAGHEYLLFIDDDEIPQPSWINSHMTAARRWDADVVAGPVVAAPMAGAPPWSDSGRLIRPEVLNPDGPYAGHVGSGNTLLRVGFCQALDLRFDPRFNFAGGEDTDFFLRCRRAGARIVWSKDSLVVERLDPERLTLSNLVARSFATGRTYAREFSDREPRRRAAFVARKLAQCVASVPEILAGSVKPVLLGRGLKRLANGLGALRGSVEAPWRHAAH